MIFQANLQIIGILKGCEMKDTTSGKPLATAIIAGEDGADLSVLFWDGLAKKVSGILPDQAVVISGTLRARKSKNGNFVNLECWANKIDVLTIP